MRSDAKKNYDHVLVVARQLVTENGPDVSMRDIARQAGVGLATLLRHFPTRESLFEALLRASLSALTQRAVELERSPTSDEALLCWLREWVTFALGHKGAVAMMAAAHTMPDSALYASCAAVHAASARLLIRAQADGSARADMTGDDLFGLMSALGWLVDLPPFAPRADHLLHILGSAILTERPTEIGKRETTGL